MPERPLPDSEERRRQLAERRMVWTVLVAILILAVLGVVLYLSS